MTALLLIVVVGQLDAGEAIPLPMTPAPEPEDAGTVVVHAAAPVPPEPEPPRAPSFAMRVGAETGVLLWPEGNPFDGLAVARPLLSFEVGESFAVELGATFNFLILDTQPYNGATELGGVLRRADWDELSDFGQIVRQLRIGKEGGPGWLRAGAVRLKTLGNGHVINRYSNQEGPNYHPAAGHGGLRVGPVRGEVFASDVLGARIFSGLVGVELGRLLASNAVWHDRFWLTTELAHDFGNAGGPRTPDLTVLQVDFSAMAVRAPGGTLQVLAGVGGRFGQRVDFGAVAGLTGELELGGASLGAKLEVRKQAGGFRHGIFGPGYELSRFAGAGFSGVPLGAQVLPDSGSVYGELRAGSRGLLVAEVAIEHFFWNRTDLDVSLQTELLGSRIVAFLRFTAIAVGVLPRYQATGEARVRIIPALYVIASGGTVFFPQPDSSLQRGLFFMGGAGIDLEAVTKK